MMLITSPRSCLKTDGNSIDRGNSAGIATDQDGLIRPAIPRILHLTLHRKWFDAIATGRKRHEFREVTEYWVKRLTDANYDPVPFDEVHFRNGYSKGMPWMRVEWKGMTGRAGLFAIKLGNILEIQNWKGPKV